MPRQLEDSLEKMFRNWLGLYRLNNSIKRSHQ